MSVSEKTVISARKNKPCTIIYTIPLSSTSLQTGKPSEQARNFRSSAGLTVYGRIRKLLEITEGTLLRYGIDVLFLNRRHTMSETGRDRAHGRCEHAHEGRGRDEDDRRGKRFCSDGSFLERGLSSLEEKVQNDFSSFSSFLSILSPLFLSPFLSTLPMRDAITVQLAHAISSRRCLLPSCLFFWPPEAAPSRPPLPPLAAAILVISGETQLRYFAPDLGFHSIPRPRVEIRGRKTRGQVLRGELFRRGGGGFDREGRGWKRLGIDGRQEKERGFVRRRGILTR